MKTSVDFVREIRATHSVKTPYAVAKLLGVSPQAMYQFEEGKVKTFSDETGSRIAELLPMYQAEYVLACLSVERAKTTEVKKIWENVAHTFSHAKRAARRAAGFIICVLLVGLLYPSPDAHASGFQAVSSYWPALVQFYITIYIIRLRRWWGRVMGKSSLWLRNLARSFRSVPAALRIAVSVLSLTAIAPAHADDWTRGEIAGETAFQALLLADWGQTRYIAHHPELYSESNPLIGTHPTIRQVNRFFIIESLLHVGVAHWLPTKWRLTFEVVSTGQKAYDVRHNYRAGVRIDF